MTGQTLDTIYAIIQLLDKNNIKVWNQINGTLFNRADNRIFIFPGQPWKKAWEFVFGEFAFLNNTRPTHRLPLQYVQHVVHDIDNVLTMLQTIPGKVHFKGSSNKDFNGPLLCWFAPLPPPLTSGSIPPCDSLDPTGSRYGCFRFTIPFKTLIRQFPKSFVLGTRKYNQEHSHAILLTESRVKNLSFIGQRQPVILTDTIFIRNSSESTQSGRNESTVHTSLQWLCFYDSQMKWDQLEFAIATKALEFDTMTHDIQLDFVNHECKICIRSLKASLKCEHSWNRSTAMRKFLIQLKEKSIELDTLMRYFSDDVWNELLSMNDSLSCKRLKKTEI